MSDIKFRNDKIDHLGSRYICIAAEGGGLLDEHQGDGEGEQEGQGHLGLQGEGGIESTQKGYEMLANRFEANFQMTEAFS